MVIKAVYPARLDFMDVICDRVYPRVCGGTCHRPGLSPRVRGNRSVVPDMGSIPACAGEPPTTPIRRSIPACAGEPGSIPACAGEPRCREVYPRVCGGTDMPWGYS